MISLLISLGISLRLYLNTTFYLVSFIYCHINTPSAVKYAESRIPNKIRNGQSVTEVLC